MALVTATATSLTSVAFVAVMASLKVLATATATSLTSVACAEEAALLMALVTATATLSMPVVFVVVTAPLVRASALQSALAQALQVVLLRRGHLC